MLQGASRAASCRLGRATGVERVLVAPHVRGRCIIARALDDEPMSRMTHDEASRILGVASTSSFDEVLAKKNQMIGAVGGGGGFRGEGNEDDSWTQLYPECRDRGEHDLHASLDQAQACLIVSQSIILSCDLSPLGPQAGGDPDRVLELEAAYDVVLMQSMKRRITGQTNVSPGVRYADVPPEPPRRGPQPQVRELPHNCTAARTAPQSLS